ncbi:transcriptional regulator [Actinocorallia longicatena]|uniref:Transcriptional regulator n=1 Tax=Actinocorallia longicatena TaxID=111803 RepID=A0ABP6Q6H5_9ACTN
MTLDPVIHAPNRLQLMSLLYPLTEAEFAFLRDHINVSDSVLSKQAAALESAGYLEIRKRTLAGRSRTWFSLTEEGRDAFDTYVTHLQALVGRPLRPPLEDRTP